MIVIVVIQVAHYDWLANSDDPVRSHPRADGARFNASARQDVVGCLEHTRVDLLGDIGCWVMDDNKAQQPEPPAPRPP